jgi:cytochrome P450
MDKTALELPQVELPRSAGALRLIRAFRSDLLAAFSANYYTELRVSFRQLGHHFVCLNDPDDIDHVLNTHMDRYQPNVLARRLLEPIVGRRGLVLAEGDDWRQQHRLLTPFFQPRHIERLIHSFHGTAATAIASWAPGGGLDRNLLVDFRRLTLAIIARTLLSIEDESTTAQLADFASEAESSGTLLQWQDYVALLIWRRVAQPLKRQDIAARWRVWVTALLDQRARIDVTREARDMLDLLLAERDGESGGPTREAIVDQVGTMLSAGFTTTALALFWTATMLALFPAHQEAVRCELCRGAPAAPPEWQSLRSSRVTTAFLYETLRLYPPAYIIAREARLEDQIGDFRIPRGSAVIIAPWVLHRHATHWQDSHRFDPNRFIQGEQIVTPRVWMPFGTGPRVCIGSAFATMEILVVLRCLLARYNIRLRGRPPRPIGRVTLVPDFQPLFTLTPL